MNYSTGHTVYKNKYKKEVPSVTTILKILNKPALQKWANGLGFRRQKLDDVLNASASLGTLFHAGVESYLQGLYFISCPKNYEEEYKLKLYLNNFIEWKKTNQLEPIFMEKELVSDKYGGTVDFYGIFNGKKTVLDFKTSKSHYSSMFLQLAAYVMMVESDGYEVEQVAILCCNTKVSVKTMTRKELEPYIEVFKILVDFFHKWYDLNLEDGWGKII